MTRKFAYSAHGFLQLNSSKGERPTKLLEWNDGTIWISLCWQQPKQYNGYNLSKASELIERKQNQIHGRVPNVNKNQSYSSKAQEFEKAPV